MYFGIFVGSVQLLYPFRTVCIAVLQFLSLINYLQVAVELKTRDLGRTFNCLEINVQNPVPRKIRYYEPHPSDFFFVDVWFELFSTIIQRLGVLNDCSTIGIH